MFDLRYHVASLAAVFLALIIGIVVGVGHLWEGLRLRQRAELLNEQIADLKSRLDSATKRSDRPDPVAARRAGLRRGRVSGADERTALGDERRRSSSPGRIDGRVRSLVEQTLERRRRRPSAPGARAQASRSTCPPCAGALKGRPALAALATQRKIGELGRRLGERVRRRRPDSPLWQALSADLVEERAGNDAASLDGSSSPAASRPQTGATARFLAGFYTGLASTDVPAVGVEVTRPGTSAVEAFAKQDLATRGRPGLGVGPARPRPAARRGRPGAVRREEDRTRRRLARHRAPRAVGWLRRLSILIAARDEEGRIGRTVGALREQFPDADVIVADDGSRDRTAAEADAAGARVLRLPRRGKGQALALAERAAPSGPLLLCDADLIGDLQPLLEHESDLAVAAFAEQQGGGFGIVKRTAAVLIRLGTGTRATGAAVGPAEAVPPRPPRLLPRRSRVRLRGADDVRRPGGRAQRRGGRAPAASPRHRARPPRVHSPRAPAARRHARVRPARGQPPRPAAPARRLGRRRTRAAGGAGRRDRPGGRSLRRIRARCGRAPAGRPHDRCPEARRHPARRPAGDP